MGHTSTYYLYLIDEKIKVKRHHPSDYVSPCPRSLGRTGIPSKGLEVLAGIVPILQWVISKYRMNDLWSSRFCDPGCQCTGKPVQP